MIQGRFVITLLTAKERHLFVFSHFKISIQGSNLQERINREKMPSIAFFEFENVGYRCNLR